MLIALESESWPNLFLTLPKEKKVVMAGFFANRFSMSEYTRWRLAYLVQTKYRYDQFVSYHCRLIPKRRQNVSIEPIKEPKSDIDRSIWSFRSLPEGFLCRKIREYTWTSDALPTGSRPFFHFFHSYLSTSHPNDSSKPSLIDVPTQHHKIE